MHFNVLRVPLLLTLINFTVFTVATKATPDSETHKTSTTSAPSLLVNKTLIPVLFVSLRTTNTGGRDKCNTSSQCTGYDTLFEKTDDYYNCYSDNACYETFQDCCPDFVKTCGEQKKTNTKNSQPL